MANVLYGLLFLVMVGLLGVVVAAVVVSRRGPAAPLDLDRIPPGRGRQNVEASVLWRAVGVGCLAAAPVLLAAAWLTTALGVPRPGAQVGTALVALAVWALVARAYARRGEWVQVDPAGLSGRRWGRRWAVPRAELAHVEVLRRRGDNQVVVSLEARRRDGSRRRMCVIDDADATGVPALVAALRQHGVPLDPTVDRQLGTTAGAGSAVRVLRWFRWAVAVFGAVVGVVLLYALGLAAFTEFWPV